MAATDRHAEQRIHSAGCGTSAAAGIFAEKEAVPLRFSIGRVCAEFVMCYPPGIPILAPGERITEAIVSYILYAKEKGLFADRFTGYDPVQLTGSSIRKGETKRYDGYLVYGKSHRPCADVHAGG